MRLTQKEIDELPGNERTTYLLACLTHGDDHDPVTRELARRVVMALTPWDSLTIAEAVHNTQEEVKRIKLYMVLPLCIWVIVLTVVMIVAL